jgi:hypothetical protein
VVSFPFEVGIGYLRYEIVVMIKGHFLSIYSIPNAYPYTFTSLVPNLPGVGARVDDVKRASTTELEILHTLHTTNLELPQGRVSLTSHTQFGIGTLAHHTLQHKNFARERRAGMEV